MIAAQKQKKKIKEGLFSEALYYETQQNSTSGRQISRQKVPAKNISWELATSQKNGKDHINEEERAWRNQSLLKTWVQRLPWDKLWLYLEHILTPLSRHPTAFARNTTAIYYPVAFSPPDMWALLLPGVNPAQPSNSACATQSPLAPAFLPSPPIPIKKAKQSLHINKQVEKALWVQIQINAYLILELQVISFSG